MSAQPEVIEGTWQEISSQAEKLSGHRLRVIILPDEEALPESDVQRRVAAFQAWVNQPRPYSQHVVDDSRAAIYGDEMDRG